MTETKRKTRRKPKPKPSGTIWEVPDDMWEKILPILMEFWPRKRTDRRPVAGSVGTAPPAFGTI
jgi:hypothetical protein